MDEIIRRKRSEVIETAINIEWLIGIIICQHYLHKIDSHFLFEVMYDEYFTMGLKRKILEKIVDKESINIEKLNRLIRIRNNFAHCGPEITKFTPQEITFIPDPRNPEKHINFDAEHQEFVIIAKELKLSLMNIFLSKGGKIQDMNEVRKKASEK